MGRGRKDSSSWTAQVPLWKKKQSRVAARWITFRASGRRCGALSFELDKVENSTMCQLLLLEGEPYENTIQISSNSKHAEKELSSDVKYWGCSLVPTHKWFCLETAEDAALSLRGPSHRGKTFLPKCKKCLKKHFPSAKTRTKAWNGRGKDLSQTSFTTPPLPIGIC